VEQIGPYKVLEELGRGGMGAVYRALDPEGNAVAVKVLSLPHEACKQRSRFERESAALKKIDHPNVVRLLDTGEFRGVPYLVTELQRHGTLERALATALLSPRVAALVGEQLAAALQAAHEQGVLHRDLKPENVLVGADGRALLTDFGLSKALDGLNESQRLTRTGGLLGTPGFWSPEQARGSQREVGPPTDVYGLGAVLYASLTGRPPVEGASLVETLIATQEQTPRPIREFRLDVSPELEAIVLRCLEKEPSARWPSALALGDALRSLLTREQPVLDEPLGWRRMPSQVVGVLLVVVASAPILAGWFAPGWFAAGGQTPSKAPPMTPSLSRLVVSSERIMEGAACRGVRGWVTNRGGGVAEDLEIRVRFFSSGVAVAEELASSPTSLGVGERFPFHASYRGPSSRSIGRTSVSVTTAEDRRAREEFRRRKAKKAKNPGKRLRVESQRHEVRADGHAWATGTIRNAWSTTAKSVGVQVIFFSKGVTLGEARARCQRTIGPNQSVSFLAVYAGSNADQVDRIWVELSSAPTKK
jgi:serine/threonine protein kinase